MEKQTVAKNIYRTIVYVLLFIPVVLAPTESFAVTPDTPGVSFGNIKDGDTVTSPVKVEMTVHGMKVAPAGTMDANTGHHHIIVDGGAVEKGAIVPADANHIHFGKGQTEAELVLTPGKHTLTLQFADGLHRSYGKELSRTIEVEVAEAP